VVELSNGKLSEADSPVFVAPAGSAGERSTVRVTVTAITAHPSAAAANQYCRLSVGSASDTCQLCLR
jgi:hypothetical protein